MTSLPHPQRVEVGKPTVPDAALPWLAVAGVLGLLELLARTDVLPQRYFPPVSEIFTMLGEQLVTPTFWTAVQDTMQGWAIGLGIAAGLAIPLGIVLGSSVWLYRAMRAIIEFLRPIPSVALIPLAVLIYGTDLQSKVFLVAFAAFWPLLVQTLYGVQDTDPVATDTARSFGYSRRQRLVLVTLPSALPYVATGLRISSATALVLAVTAEIVIGAPGLGREITLAQGGNAVDLMYAYIVTTGLIGWMLNVGTTRLERRLLAWHPSHRDTEGA